MSKHDGDAQSEEQVAEQQPSSAEEAVQDGAKGAPISAVDGTTALHLLKRAHAELLDRKQNIESEITRLDGLTKELEGVNTQIEALDKTLTVFAPQPV